MHVLVEAPQDRVVLQERREGVVVGEVVDGNDLDVGGTECLLCLDRPEEVAPDASESVHAYADSHNEAPLPSIRWSWWCSCSCDLHPSGMWPYCGEPPGRGANSFASLPRYASSSNSAVTADSVSGLPSSLARRAAVARRRRLRP